MTISDKAKEKVAAVLKEGECAIDATLGNGWDTLFLAQCVGENGRVFGFDVQEAALMATGKRLAKVEAAERCELFLSGHEEMGEKVSCPVGAVMFNLGYLPYAGEKIITKGATTKTALQAAVDLLRVGGVVTVICYLGHPGGREEASDVLAWTKGLGPDFAVEGVDELPEQDSPFLLVVTKVS